MLRRFLNFKFFFLPANADASLLTLRVFAGLSLFLRHGYFKVFTFAAMIQRFQGADIFHIGVIPTLIIALISDGICSILIMFGVATRWAALYCFGVIFTAWAFNHHFIYFGGEGQHGEVIVFYLTAFLSIFLAGPGRYSIDRLLTRTDSISKN